jgi:Cache domain
MENSTPPLEPPLEPQPQEPQPQEAKKINWSKLVYKSSIALSIVSGFLVAGLIFSYWYEKNKTEEFAKSQAKEEAEKAIKTIDQNLQNLQSSVTSIANNLTEEKISDTDLPDTLRSTMEKNVNFFDLGVAYLPEAAPNNQLYIPTYRRKNGKLQFTSESSYNYTKPEKKTEWFNRPLKEGAMWLDPFYGEGSGAVLAEYSSPFYRVDAQTKQKKVAGVVYADYSLQDLKAMMNALNLGKTGYGFLLSKTGVFISHPIDEYIKNGNSIFDFAKERNTEGYQQLGEKAIKGESGLIEVTDKKTGLSSWIFYKPISSTGWTMGVVFFKHEVITNADSLQKKQTLICLALIAFLFFSSILMFRAYTGKRSRIWAVVYTSNLLFISGIGYIWYLAWNEQSYENSTESKIVLIGRAGLNKFLDLREQQLSTQVKAEKPIYIPTGVFVQSLEFNTANNVTITGYIWQRFTKGVNDKVTRGFVMPESVDKIDVTESYKRKEGDQEIVGWYFRAKLRQSFDYSQYPLDYKDVWIRLWAKDFDKNVILTPDFDSYPLMNPLSKPGVAKDLVLSGWYLDSSFFQYYLNSYNTNFGITNYVGQEQFPELYFTVVIRRSLLPIFIGNIIPLAVVSFLLFSLLIITRKKAYGPLALGFSAKDGIVGSSGLLFIVLLNQINLRNAIAALGIIYIEYFYFVIYIMVLLVIINSLLFVFGSKLRLIEYEDNLVPKLLYCPTLLGLLLMITVGVFF